MMLESHNLGLLAAMPLLGRTVPLLGYCVVSRQRRLIWRLGSVFSIVLAYLLLHRVSQPLTLVLVDIGLANGWLLVAAVLLYLAYRRVSIRTAAGFLDGSIALFLGLAVPLSVFPGDMWPLVGPLGWEFSLSGYSYARRARTDGPPNLGDCLFFMMVNPVLVYDGHRERVSHDGAQLLRWMARLSAGYLAVVVALWLPSHGSLPFLDESPLLGAVLFATVTYAAHSGRASQEIALLNLLGYPIPERYHYPFLSRSPQDFWKRWNTYVGEWAKRYLFFPANRFARRSGLPRGVSVLVAVFATFLGIGLLHETVVVWRLDLHPFGFTLWFLLNALLLVAWRAVAALRIPEWRGWSRTTALLAARFGTMLLIALAGRAFLA